MTYKNALKISIGDTLYSKDGYKFVVEKITEESNVANTEQFLRFSGKCSRGFQVSYRHKNIKVWFYLKMKGGIMDNMDNFINITQEIHDNNLEIMIWKYLNNYMEQELLKTEEDLTNKKSIIRIVSKVNRNKNEAISALCEED